MCWAIRLNPPALHTNTPRSIWTGDKDALPAKLKPLFFCLSLWKIEMKFLLCWFYRDQNPEDFFLLLLFFVFEFLNSSYCLWISMETLWDVNWSINHNVSYAVGYSRASLLFSSFCSALSNQSQLLNWQCSFSYEHRFQKKFDGTFSSRREGIFRLWKKKV